MRNKQLVLLAVVALFAVAGFFAARAYAGPTLREVVAFEVTCGSTATRIRPSSGYLASSGLHAFTCFMSRDTPDDSAECVMIGGANVDNDSNGYPIGGCAKAENSQISVDGDAYCIQETASVVIECLGGIGVP